jgi:hypothetical protein
MENSFDSETKEKISPRSHHNKELPSSYTHLLYCFSKKTSKFIEIIDTI